MQDFIHPSAHVLGEMRCCRVHPCRQPFAIPQFTARPNIADRKKAEIKLPGLWLPEHDFERNTILYEWATIVGELLRKAPDKKPYGLGGMYIEFENNAGAAVSPPTVARGEGGTYYEDLLASPNRDYLRVPLTAATLTSTDEDNFPFGNRVTAFAQTQGVAGTHGKTFSAAQQSRVYGAALVTFPDFGDATQDLVLSRFYYSDTSNQMIKITGSEIGVEWRVNLL